MGKGKREKMERTRETEAMEQQTADAPPVEVQENADNDFDGRDRLPHSNCTFVVRDSYPYAKPLTDADRLDLAAKLSDSMGKIEKLEYQLKQARDACKEAVDAERGIVGKCARCIRSGTFEAEKIPCDVYKDWDTMEMVWISHDEERKEIHRRKMTVEEQQPTLLDGPNNKGDGEK